MNKNITNTVIKVFSEMPQGNFHGWDIKNKCVALDQKLEHTYEDTFLRIMRKHFHDDYELVDHGKSLYRKTGKVLHVDYVQKSKPVNPYYEQYKDLKQKSFDFMGGN